MAKAKARLTPVPKPSARKNPGRKPEASRKDADAPPDLSHIAESLRPLAVPLSEVAFLTGNPLKHPPEQIDELRASLRTFGQVEPLVVNRRPSPAVVIGGNGRMAGMLAENWSHAAVCYVDLDEAKANALAIVLNASRAKATWDTAALDAMMADMDLAEDPALEKMMDELRAEQLAPPDAAEDTPPAAETEAKYHVLIDCADEAAQLAMLERFTEEGMTCRALTA